MRCCLLLLLPAMLAGAPARAAAPAAEHRDSAGREWEAAIGLLADYAAEYSGAGRHRIDAEPVVYLRWGRFSLSNRSGFVNRRNDAVVRGIGFDFVATDEWRVATSLRYDRGRDEIDSGDLAGLGEVRATVRLRLSTVWRPQGTRWRLGAAWNGDAIGRGGGWYSEFSVGREWVQDPARTWTVGVALAAGSSRYLQNRYGVTAEQATRTGYPVYTPGAGLRDSTLFANLRWTLSEHWVVTAGGGYTHKMGPTRRSPLVRDTGAVSLTLGAAYSF